MISCGAGVCLWHRCDTTERRRLLSGIKLDVTVEIQSVKIGISGVGTIVSTAPLHGSIGRWPRCLNRVDRRGPLIRIIFPDQNVNRICPILKLVGIAHDGTGFCPPVRRYFRLVLPLVGGRAIPDLLAFGVRRQNRRQRINIVGVSKRRISQNSLVGIRIVIILSILFQAQKDLFQVRFATGFARPVARRREDGKQNRRQNGDNRDDDEQFHQCEAGADSTGRQMNRKHGNICGAHCPLTITNSLAILVGFSD